jgi:hypothetical protein
MLHLRLSLLFAIDEKPARTPGAEFAGFIGREFVAHIHFALGQRIM